MRMLRNIAISLYAISGITFADTWQTKAPIHGLEEVFHQHVNLRGGFWGARLYTHQRKTVPHVLDHLEKNHFLHNFDLAAKSVPNGKTTESDVGDQLKAAPKEIIGHPSVDSEVYKSLEGACHALGHCDNPDLLSRVNDMLDRILAAQGKDGYLNSYFTAKEPDKRWADMRMNHELYTAGHFMEFAVEHSRLTGETKALDAAKKFADLIDQIFGPGKRYDVCGHPEIELALVKLYRATGEKRYLDLSRFFLDERGHAHGMERKPFTPAPFLEPKREVGMSDEEYQKAAYNAKLYWRNGRMQDHKPLVEQTDAVGHAVRAAYVYSAMTDIARFSDAPEYGNAVRTLWNDVVKSKMHLTGGIGTAQHGDQEFGDPYLLPNKTHCESCASIAHVFWQHRMFLMDGQSKYIDVMELALYNSALSGISLSGDQFFHQNPLESVDGSARSNWTNPPCCSTNLARFTPQVGGLAYAKSKERIYVNLYASGHADIELEKGKFVNLRQDTFYPLDGRINLAITTEQTQRFVLSLRIPGWVRGHPVPSDLYRFSDPAELGYTVVVNGGLVEAVPDANGYVNIDREWKTGDVVDLNLPMAVNRVYSHEKVEENRGRVALMLGPLVYCFEGLDHPGADLFKIELPQDSFINSQYRDFLLSRMNVVQTVGIDANGNSIPLLGIPYYAWANRDKTPMNIWLRERKIENKDE